MTGISETRDLALDQMDYRLETSRLRLQEIRDGDACELWPLVSDSGLTTFLAWNAHQSIAETEALVCSLVAAHRAGSGFHWIVRRAGKVVGLVSLIDIRRQHRCWTHNRAELAYWIGRPFNGNGLATEAAAAVVNFAFSQLRLHKIRVYHATGNVASKRTIEKLGFRLVGEERDAFQKEGIWHNLRHFEMLVSEQPARLDVSTEDIK